MSSSKEPHSAETETAGNMAAAEPAVSNDHMDRWLERFAHAAFQRSADTAHDLKTPLNVAVLNLELLRMRMRKLGGSDDEKVLNYARSIEVELRRLARIFDAFFLFSVPPKGEENPAAIDLGAICREAGRADGYELGDEASFSGHAHESRIRTAFKLFFEGTGRVLQPQSRTARLSIAAKEMTVEVSGMPAPDDFELTRIFKFYYTDPSGNPDLSLATARLIVETYGGELVAMEENGHVSIRLSIPGDE